MLVGPAPGSITVVDEAAEEAVREAAREPALLAEASEHAQRVALEEREMTNIDALDLPTFVLPAMPTVRLS